MKSGGRILLALALAVTGLAKLLSGHEPHYLLGAGPYFWVGVGEVALSGMLALERCTCSIAVLVQVGAAAAIVAAFASPSPCGCFGALFEASRSEHVMLASALGLLACLVRRQSRRTPISPPP